MTATTPAPSSSSSPADPRALRIALWVLQGLLALVFVVGSALPKFLGDPYAIKIFTDMGMGQWLRYAVGALELAGGVGLLVPRVTAAAAAGLTALMIGATVAQLTVLTEGFWYTPVILGVLTATVAWLRRPASARR